MKNRGAAKKTIKKMVSPRRQKKTGAERHRRKMQKTAAAERLHYGRCFTYSKQQAHADSDAPFIVRTALVGEGAEVKAKLKTNRGKTLEKIRGKMIGNWFHGRMPIPEKVKMDDMLYIEVELPKHGLN